MVTMTPRLIWILVLALALAIMKFAPRLARRLTLLLLGKSGREAVGRKALAVQPDRITLVPSSVAPGAAARAYLDAFAARGFTPAGTFAIPEMKGIPVHFMVQPAQEVGVVVYEHRAAGTSCEVYSRYQDGTSFSVSSSSWGSGLDQRPGHPSVRVRARTAGRCSTASCATARPGSVSPLPLATFRLSSPPRTPSRSPGARAAASAPTR